MQIRTILNLDKSSRLIIEAVRLKHGFKTQSEASNFLIKEYARIANIGIDLSNYRIKESDGDQDE